MEKSYAVSKVKTMLLISGITDYQKMAMEKAAEAETDQEINEAVEYMGVAQGIINTVFTLGLIDKDEREMAANKQGDIAEEIKKSTRRLADRKVQNK